VGQVHVLEIDLAEYDAGIVSVCRARNPLSACSEVHRRVVDIKLREDYVVAPASQSRHAGTWPALRR
jgi:hypothetical protein